MVLILHNLIDIKMYVYIHICIYTYTYMYIYICVPNPGILVQYILGNAGFISSTVGSRSSAFARSSYSGPVPEGDRAIAKDSSWKVGTCQPFNREAWEELQSCCFPESSNCNP